MENFDMHYRMVIVLAAFDPYKDIFDIFIEQFKKNWPDCPYPLIISNMYFKCDLENVYVINCGDVKDPALRLKMAIDMFDADYYLGFEEDRIIMRPVNTKEVERILEFMDSENILYYRCNSSVYRKKKSDQYNGYEHCFHIPANEPYGVCGSTVIWSNRMMHILGDEFDYNGYKWESYQNERAATSHDKWLDYFATDNRNLFHILHCIEKQKWIAKSRRLLIKQGYDIPRRGREIQSFGETLMAYLKYCFKLIPGKTRFYIKKLLKKVGFDFVTDY